MDPDDNLFPAAPAETSNADGSLWLPVTGQDFTDNVFRRFAFKPG